MDSSAVCIYSRLKAMKIRIRGDKVVISSRRQKEHQINISISDEIDDVIDYAIGVVNSITAVSALHECSRADDNSSEIKGAYKWLVLKIKSWQYPTMIDTKGIVYLFKQVVNHVDLVYAATIVSPEKTQFTIEDQEVYISVLEEYRRVLKSKV
jgi:hypothetical protein